MSEPKDLVLSEVIHQAFVEVNAEGTEAAAATRIGLVGKSRERNLAYFRADHPFLFFIRHNSTMSILFAGRVCTPAWALCSFEQCDSGGRWFHLVEGKIKGWQSLATL